MPQKPTRTVRALVWSENTEPRRVYPCGIHGAVAEHLNCEPDITARTAELADPDFGLSETALSASDVLLWWGHERHHDIPDEVAQRIAGEVIKRGLGFIAIHSSHFSKSFKMLLGTSCSLGSWKESGKLEHIHVVSQNHPIAEGVSDFILPESEQYGEPFDVPEPDEVILKSTWEDGTWFRSGCLWQRGRGKVFYFSPGHETYPNMYDPNVRRILTNAVRHVTLGL